jgi:antitoxin component of MazEF toxin-antitoxin module
MVKRLVKHGNSLALVIDRPLLDLLHIDAETFLDVQVDGKSLVVTPVQADDRKKKFLEALENGNRRYGRALKKLAE